MQLVFYDLLVATPFSSMDIDGININNMYAMLFGIILWLVYIEWVNIKWNKDNTCIIIQYRKKNMQVKQLQFPNDREMFVV